MEYILAGEPALWRAIEMGDVSEARKLELSSKSLGKAP